MADKIWPSVEYKVEPKRRAAIVKAYGELQHGLHRTENIIYYVRSQCGHKSISQFLDHASDHQIAKLERLLKK